VLTDKMVEAIKYFINTSEEDLEYIFGEVIYFFFYKLLNPLSQNSFLMNNDFQKNIEVNNKSELKIHLSNY
jgi:hypothetical protein